MFCKNCGHNLKEAQKFCTKCGHSSVPAMEKGGLFGLHDKWWYRLAKVVYILLYLPILALIPLTWMANAPYYSAYSNQYRGSYSEAYWYSILVFLVYILILRLLKIAFLYVALAIKPQWRAEFKKLF